DRRSACRSARTRSSRWSSPASRAFPAGSSPAVLARARSAPGRRRGTASRGGRTGSLAEQKSEDALELEVGDVLLGGVVEAFDQEARFRGQRRELGDEGSEVIVGQALLEPDVDARSARRALEVTERARRLE